MDYLENYKKMISLRGLTDHTMISYCTYITAYLDFAANTLHVQPSEVGYPDIIRFLDSLKEERGLSDRTINCAISQIRFFTMYVLHKPWDPTQVPMRRFDTYLPYVPVFGSAKSAVSVMRTSSAGTCGSISRMARTGPTGTPSFPAQPLISSHSTGSPVEDPPGGSSQNRRTPPVPSTPSSCRGISVATKKNSDGPGGSPAIHSATLLARISTRTAPTS